MNIHGKKRQQGFTLTEALVSFVIVTGGLLAIASFQTGLLSNSAYNKARTEAMALAEQKIEELRHYTHADESNYIDVNNDDIMDADGTYSDAPIEGRNTVFLRSWTLNTTGDGKRVDVSVAWSDSANETQSVVLSATIPWISPRAGADQIAEYQDQYLVAPTGGAKIGEGKLSDYPPAEVSLVDSAGPDGLRTFRHDADLFLVDGGDNILLTLLDACSTDTGACTDFVKISGTVYLDTVNTTAPARNLNVLASDAAYCQRWVTSGTLSSPPTTSSGDYEYYEYNCYLGGGWHGNIGLVKAGGLQQADKFCQGDPTSLNAWEEPVIATRRVYRGMLQKTVGGQTLYESHGIRDAAVMDGHDFVYTRLDASFTEGTYCETGNAPMTRTDSSNGRLFEDVPADFICLNLDHNNDGLPDDLDSYDTTAYVATTSCPFDPSDPPVQSHTIDGVINILSATALDLSAFNVVTSDGPGNCTFTTPFQPTADGYQAAYSCSVFDWGNGWNGYVQLVPNSNSIYCPNDITDYSNVGSDQSTNYGCIAQNTVGIEGIISLPNESSAIYSITATDLLTGLDGSCRVDNTAYRCVVPFDGISVDIALTVSSSGAVCDAVGGVFTFLGYTLGGSPYQHDIVIEETALECTL